MPESTDLVGVGVPPYLANLLGNDDSILTTTTTSQSTAALIKTNNVELSTSGGQTAAILSASLPIGTPVYCFTSTATTALVFCPVGHTMNGSSNGSVSIAQNKAAIIWQYKKNFWCSVLTA